MTIENQGTVKERKRQKERTMRVVSEFPMTNLELSFQFQDRVTVTDVVMVVPAMHGGDPTFLGQTCLNKRLIKTRRICLQLKAINLYSQDLKMKAVFATLSLALLAAAAPQTSLSQCNTGRQVG